MGLLSFEIMAMPSEQVSHSTEFLAGWLIALMMMEFMILGAVLEFITKVAQYMRTQRQRARHFKPHHRTKPRRRYPQSCNISTMLMINLNGQDMVKINLCRKGVRFLTSVNQCFHRFDLYSHVYATIALLLRYQHYRPLTLFMYQTYRPSPWLCTKPTDQLVPFRWSVCEHW
jgi:hypothetical protein